MAVNTSRDLNLENGTPSKTTPQATPLDRARRYVHIASVLSRHGLGYVANLAGIQRFVPFHRKLLGIQRRNERHTQVHDFRLALEELGPAFMKLGQILSTRGDVLPQEVQDELSKLQDQAQPVPTAEIRMVIEAEIGMPIESAFKDFSSEPIAAASIGQAHAATLMDGTEVVVKIRRPGVVDQIKLDLSILADLARIAAERWEPGSVYDLPGLVDEFGRILLSELDYVREGKDAERFAVAFADNAYIHVPRIVWQYTTQRVLTMERIRGAKINDAAGLAALEIDLPELAKRLVQINLEAVFQHGFFHGDPHPGNFFVEDGGRIGLIDYGIVGHVDSDTRRHLAALLGSVVGMDPSRIVEPIMALGVTHVAVDKRLLQRDLGELVERYFGSSLQEVKISELLNDILTVMRRHTMQLPSSLSLLIKTLIMIEGLAAQVDQSVSMATLFAPYVKGLMHQDASPLSWSKLVRESSVEAAQLGVDLPHRIRGLLGDLERGQLQVTVRQRGLGAALERLEILANRIVAAVLAGAFIIGLAVLMLYYHPELPSRLVGYAFAFGFGAALVLGFKLVGSALKVRTTRWPFS